MRWVTRAGCHVDRAACAWLIRRFIDPDAQFGFVDDPAEVPADAAASPPEKWLSADPCWTFTWGRIAGANVRHFSRAWLTGV